MAKKYPTKTVILDFKGQTVEKIVAADLRKVYVTDKEGKITVYYDANKIINGKHLYSKGKKDFIVREAKKYSDKGYL